jgi:hypothetical protein
MNYDVRNLIAVLLFGAMILLLGACASTPRVSVVRDPGSDFSEFSTFGFRAPLGTDRDTGGKEFTRTVLSGTLENAARSELESLGYVFDADSPDLQINFYVESREVIQGRRGPSYSIGYGYYHRPYGVWTGYETDIRQYTESTLHVDVVDVAKNQLIWEGISAERLSGHDLAFEPENVTASLTRIFADFPRRRLDIRE